MMSSEQMYAPDYLRQQEDKNMHNIADMVEENIERYEKLQTQLRKAEEVIREIKDFDNNDHLDVVGCELQEIAREYFKEKEQE